MQIAIYNRALSDDDFSIYKKMFEILSRYNIKPVIFEPFVEKLKAFNSLPDQYEIFSDVKPLTNKVNFLFQFFKRRFQMQLY